MCPLMSLGYPQPIGERVAQVATVELTNPDGERTTLREYDRAKVLVLMFMANRCPTARVYTERINAIQRDYATRGVQVVGINSDDQYLFPLESLPEMKRIATERRYEFPYLKDDTQELGKGIGAIVTLHAFVLDEQRAVRYRGRVDDSRDPNLARTRDLRDAIEALLEGREVKVPETRPFACAIEYT